VETELKWLRTTNNVTPWTTSLSTTCELLYQQRKKVKLVAHSSAEVPIKGGTIHAVLISEGYARVMID
jgi:hypothetical protein